MSESVTLNKRITQSDVEAIIRLGIKLAAQKLEPKEVDGPFYDGDRQVFIVYTKDQRSQER
jgi:hypothetical protein